MAKIVEFDNGTRVQFEGNPTAADINEASVNLGITKPKDNRDLLQKASDMANSVFPNQNLGKIIGNSLYAVGQDVQGLIKGGPKGFYDAVMASGPDVTPAPGDFKKVVGDVSGDVLNGLLFATGGGGASLLGKMGSQAALSGGLSAANSLSQGKDLLGKDTLGNAAGSAAIGAIFPYIGSEIGKFNKVLKSGAGISPQIEKQLIKSTPEEVQNYIQTALTHNSELNSPTPIGLASQKLAEAGQMIKTKINDAGKAVGAARKAAGEMMIKAAPTGEPAIDSVLSNFTKQIEEKFGHEISMPRNESLTIGNESVIGSKPDLIPLEGRSREIAPTEKTRIMKIYDQLSKLADSPQVKTATDVVHNLDDLVDWNKVDQYGINHDPLESTLRSIRGQLNGAIRASSPEVADANDTFSRLKELDKGIGQLGGKDLQRGELLLRRVFSGDKSRDSLNLLNDISSETGIDLIKHSALAKFATDNFGDETSKTLFKQAIGLDKVIANARKQSVIGSILDSVNKRITPNTEKYAMNLANGSPYANTFDQLVNSPASRNLLTAYTTNLAAAHPEAGKSLLKGSRNLINNVTGLGI